MRTRTDELKRGSSWELPRRGGPGVSLVVALAVLGSSSGAGGHPRGTHKRVVVSLDEDRVTALLTVDFDSGERAAGLRARADADGDGRLAGGELGALKERLAVMALEPFGLSIGGHSPSLEREGVKLNVRGVRVVCQEGLSIAVLLGGRLPTTGWEGMTLEVRDHAPDGSPARVEVGVRARGRAPRSERVKASAGRPASVTL